MAEPDTGIDIGDLIDAIIADLAAAFPALTVEAYQEDRRDVHLPGVMVSLLDMEPDPDDDPMTEQLAVVARFQAHVILGFRTPSVMREAPRLAGALAKHIHQRRFGRPITPGVVTMIEQDQFLPELDQFEVWRVDWQHVLHLGVSVWNNDGVIPTQILLSYPPKIGPGNEEHYFDVTDVGLPEDIGG